MNTPNPAPVTTSDAERAAPIDMLLCEFGRLVPLPNVTYRPIYMPGCAECDRLAALQQESYGKRAPTYEEAEAALPVDFKQATDQGGWQWVPKEPTEEMLNAGKRMLHNSNGRAAREKCGRILAAMLEAAPTLQGVADGAAA